MGPGDPAAHRTNRLPLLPSGPGGVHRVLLHRARPRYSYDIYPNPLDSRGDGRANVDGEEGGHSKSRSRVPTEGARPLVSPHAGEPLPRDPPRSNPTASVRDGNSNAHAFSTLQGSIRWRRGWDSNPRSRCRDACFPSMSIRPLSHLSAIEIGRAHV